MTGRPAVCATPDSAELDPDPPAEPPRHAALLHVQALRALAAMIVIFVHLEPLAARAGLAPAAFEFGNAGVDIFFVISGFIMVYTTGRKPVGPIHFIGDRLRRIAPLYWTVTLAVFAVALAAPHLLQGTRADPRHLLASLGFLPYPRADGSYRPVVFVGWTLNYEMAFYVVFAAGLALRRRLLGIGLSLAILTGAILWGVAIRPTEPLMVIYTQPMIAEFGLGMILGTLWPRLPTLEPRAGRAALMAVMLLALAAIVFDALVWPSAERALAFGLPAFALVAAALLLERAGWSLRWRWIRALGDASYAIYLTHFFVTQAAAMAVQRLGLSGPLPMALAGALALGGAAAVGLAVHRLVEKPMDAALRRLFRSASRPTAKPQAVTV